MSLMWRCDCGEICKVTPDGGWCPNCRAPWPSLRPAEPSKLAPYQRIYQASVVICSAAYTLIICALAIAFVQGVILGFVGK